MIKDLIIYILFIIIIMLYKTKETLTNTNDDTLTDFIINDKKAISNILNFTNKFVTNNDSYNIKKNIIVDDLNIYDNCFVDGNLNIINTLSFNFNFSGNMLLDILPRYSIINFHNKEISVKLPKKWVDCDGKKWYINITNDNDITNVEPENINNYEVITVPDLTGRFLFGAGNNNKIKTLGGKDMEIITPQQLPNHYHPTNIVRNRDITNFKYSRNKIYNEDKPWLDINYDDPSGNTYILDTNKYGNIGANNINLVNPHENMPPYLVTRYIMKI
jgi:microcystin-dependent protein